jgi:hypothetical protein
MKITKRQLRRIIREEKNKLLNEIGGRSPAAYGKGGPNITGQSKGFGGVRGEIDDQINSALSAAQAARDLLPGDNPISRKKAGEALEVAIKALLKASNVYRL